MEIIFALVIVLGATAVILSLDRFAKRLSFSVSDLEYINTQSKYQALLFGVAILLLIAIYFVNQTNFSTFLALGNITAPAKGVIWMGIANDESWLRVGASLSFFITLATFIFVYLQFRKSGKGIKLLMPYLPWILLFSLTNSFSEEIVFRLGIIVPLFGVIDTTYILLISAVAFAIPHLRGMPNGIVGALMAGLLGWLLAKSVVETDGIFWAMFIHFLQDIVIFSAFVMATANKSLTRNHSADAPPVG